MKNFFKSIGKAALYFSVYYAVQFIVSFVYGTVWSAKKTAELMSAGETVDAMALSEQLVAHLMEDQTLLLLTVCSGVIIFAIYWIRFAIRKKNFFQQVEIKKIAANGILLIVITALSMNVVLSVAISNLPWPQEWIDAYMTNSASIDGSLLSWLAAVVMAPVLEEIVFRGLIYTRLKKGMPTIVAAILASFVFGLCHGTAIWIIYATGLGLVMTWVFEKYQSLTASILFHLSFNTMGLIISMIPESMEIVVWSLLAVSVVGLVYGVKQLKNVTVVEAPVMEQVEEFCEA